MRACLPLLLCCLALGAVGAQDRPAPFVLKDGDRVVLVGGGLIEHDQFHGFLEARLLRRDPDAHIVFRNLGWGGDTVRGGARTGGFENPDGIARLLKETRDLKPTVIFLGYGMNESFEAARGLPAFRADYAKLLAELQTTKARLVLLAPTHHEDLGRPLPDPAAHNRDLAQYAAAIRQLADERGLPFVDLFAATQQAHAADPKRRLTTNGIQLNATGYAVVAEAIERRLGFMPRVWRVELDQAGKIAVHEGCRITNVKAADDRLRFDVVSDLIAITGDVHRLRITGLALGKQVMHIDGRRSVAASAAEWQQGVELDAALFDDGERLRAAIVAKGELNYRRWRPFNDHSRHWTFIGADFALYDRGIAEQEKRSATLRRPTSHVCEIRPEAK